MQIRSELISIAKLDTVASLYVRKTLHFLVSRRNIELKQANMNSLIQVIKISKALKTQSPAGRISLRFNRMCARVWPTRRI